MPVEREVPEDRFCKSAIDMGRRRALVVEGAGGGEAERRGKTKDMVVGEQGPEA